MPELTKLLVDALRLRISDPGAFLPRDHSGPESIPNWGARAIHAGLDDGTLGHVPADQLATVTRERDEARQDVQSLTDDLSAVRTERDQIDAELAEEKTDNARLKRRCDRLTAEGDHLAAVVRAAYAFADEMAGYCSPHGVSSTYAKRLREALDKAGTGPVPEAEAHAQGYAEAVARLRDDERYRNWWTARPGAPGSYPVYWDGPGRTHLADYLETVGPDGIDVETGIGVRSAGRALLEVLQYVALPFEANRAAYRLRCAFGMPDAPQPVNETESSGAAARRLAGELERLLEGLAERGITPAPDCPVGTAAVDTALAAVNGLESTVRMMEGAVRLARGPAAECGAGCGEGHRYDKKCGLSPIILGPTRRLRERPTVVERLRSADLLLESAWGVIANVGNPLGDWDSMPQQWREAAVEWVRGYHAWLDERRVASPKLAQGAGVERPVDLVDRTPPGVRPGSHVAAAYAQASETEAGPINVDAEDIDRELRRD